MKPQRANYPVRYHKICLSNEVTTTNYPVKYLKLYLSNELITSKLSSEIS